MIASLFNSGQKINEDISPSAIAVAVLVDIDK